MRDHKIIAFAALSRMFFVGLVAIMCSFVTSVATGAISVSFNGTAINSTTTLSLGTNGNTTAVNINASQNVITANSGALLAQNATNGFFYVPGCATGTPSGTPSNLPTGAVPLVWDNVNKVLYAYSGGAWNAVPGQAVTTVSTVQVQKVNINQLQKTVHASVTGTTQTIDTTAIFWPCDTTSNNITITLPTAVSNSGLTYTIKWTTNASAHTLTLATTSAQTIDGVTTYTFPSGVGQSVSVYSDGSNWVIY